MHWTKQEVIEQIRANILAQRQDVVAIVLFGSFLKGEDPRDIDVLVVVNEMDKSPLERKEDILAMKAGLDLPVDVLLFSRDECVDNFEVHMPLFLDIAFDGHIIYDDGFIAELMERTREYVRKKEIERTETGGWRFPVKFRESTPLSTLENREWAEIWLNDAKRDLAAAIRLFEDGLFDKCVTHSQQAVEKVVKSVLICFGAYERIHYVSGILAKELKRQELGQWSERLRQLADYARDLEPDATLSRYPGMFKGRVWIPYREYDEVKAKEALQKARFALDNGRAFIAWWFGDPESTIKGVMPM